MTLSLEWVLLALVAALYLQDSLVLLYTNEAVLILDHSGKHGQMRFGSDRFRMAGREVLLLPVLRPGAAAYKLAWHAEPILPRAHGGSRTSLPFPPALRTVRPALPVVAASVFVGLPAIAHWNLGWLPFGVVVGAGFGAAIYGLVRAWGMRDVFSLNSGRFAKLAFETLACLPCAINLVRKLTLSVPLAYDITDLAREVLDDAQYTAMIDEIRRRVDEELEMAESGSDTARQLEAYRARLENTTP